MGDSFTAPVGSGALVLRSARVISTLRETGGALELSLEVLEGPLRGEQVTGRFYGGLGEPPGAGDVVAANTVGLEMGLGTGGVAP
ncbi:MAG: hypothetical protein M3157_07240, partial [Actinomycetota bacterium]|nr:hypothetical protein [Actinomycetota bacterium]